MRAATALLLLALLAPSARGAAQGLIQLQVGAGELAVEARADRRGYSRGSNMRDRSAREWIRIPFRGATPAAQLFSYTLVLRPQVGQQVGTGLPQPFDTRATGVDLTVSMLQSRHGGLNLFSTRQHGSAEGGLGGESFYATRGRGATLRLTTRFLPLVFDVNERRTEDSWQGAFDESPFRRSERFRVARVAGTGSKTSVQAERTAFRDNIGTTSFDATSASFSHRARWGRGSLLESVLEHADRAGYDPYLRNAWSERLQLQHSATVGTTWRFQRRASTTFGLPSSGSAVGGALRLDATRWMSATLQADRSTSRFPAGASRATAITPRLTVRRQLDRAAWLHASVSTGYEDVRRELASGDQADAAEERARVEASRTMQLAKVNADAGSVVVRSADQSITYREPEDYRVLALGPVVRLQFPAGSRIATGDVVVVTYRYLLLQRTPYRVLGASADASLAFPWFHVRHSVTGRAVKALDGAATSVPEQGVDDALAIGMARPVAGGNLELEVERRRRVHSIANYGVREARALFVPRPRGAFTSSLGLGLNRSTAATQAIGVVSGNAALGWTPSTDLRLQASLDTWTWHLADAPTERFTGLSMHAAWRVGALETEWRYWYQLREQVVRGVEHRFWARVIRHF